MIMMRKKMLELKRDAEGGELSEQASGDAPPHISQPHCDDDDFDCDMMRMM